MISLKPLSLEADTDTLEAEERHIPSLISEGCYLLMNQLCKKDMKQARPKKQVEYV